MVSAHREENIDGEANFEKLRNMLNSLAHKYGKTVIVSTHPRTRKKLDTVGANLTVWCSFISPRLLRLRMPPNNSAAVLSDSGTISEESSLLKFPALNLRGPMSARHSRRSGYDDGARL